MQVAQSGRCYIFLPFKRKFVKRVANPVPAAVGSIVALQSLTSDGKTLELPANIGGHVTYQLVDSIDYEQVSELLAKVDWPARQQSKLETALQNSYMLATLVSHLPQESPALIGMARVVSDGAFNAQLWDVIVDPSFQGVGLGRQLVSEVVQSLLKEDICNIVTFAEKSGTKFYQKLGFQSDPDNVKGMFYRKML
jgi:GNAT superfamily N-acetyltransferase